MASALPIELGDPVLFGERLMFARGERPIEVVRSHHRADVYRYRIGLVRTSPPHGRVFETWTPGPIEKPS